MTECRRIPGTCGLLTMTEHRKRIEREKEEIKISNDFGEGMRSAVTFHVVIFFSEMKESQVADNVRAFPVNFLRGHSDLTEKPGNSSVVSTPQKTGSAPTRLVDLDTVHVTVMADYEQFPGLLALTNSIVCNTAWPVSFHFVTFPSNATHLREWILGSKLKNITFEIVELSESALKGKYLSRSFRADISHPLNFARFYLQTLFPSVGKIIFLDADCLLLGDIKELYNISLDFEHPVSMLRSCDIKRNYYSDIKNLVNFSNADVAKASISRDACILNAGVFLADLVLWDRQNILQQLEYWMTLNTRSVVFRPGDAGSGSQGPMNMVFHSRFIPLPPEWNAVGGDEKVLKVPAKLIHFNGSSKPWRSCSSETWKRYAVPDPSAKVNVCV